MKDFQGNLDYNFTFLIELPVKGLKRGLLLALQEDPRGVAARNAYHDYLLEQDRPQSAQNVLSGYTSGLLSRPGPYNTTTVDASMARVLAGPTGLFVERELQRQKEEMFRRGPGQIQNETQSRPGYAYSYGPMDE
jgi:hypothetical protein